MRVCCLQLSERWPPNDSGNRRYRGRDAYIAFAGTSRRTGSRKRLRAGRRRHYRARLQRLRRRAEQALQRRPRGRMPGPRRRATRTGSRTSVARCACPKTSCFDPMSRLNVGQSEATCDEVRRWLRRPQSSLPRPLLVVMFIVLLVRQGRWASTRTSVASMHCIWGH